METNYSFDKVSSSFNIQLVKSASLLNEKYFRPIELGRDQKGYSQVSGPGTQANTHNNNKTNMPASPIVCPKSTWMPVKKRIRKLQIPKDLTIVGKKWKKKHKNPVVALRMSMRRSHSYHQIRLSRFKSWTQESYQFLQIEDKKPEKIVIDLVSDSDEESS